jgi:hypothetical protein
MTLKTGPPDEYKSLLKRAIDSAPIETSTSEQISEAAAKFTPMLYDVLVKDGYLPINARRIVVNDTVNKENWPYETVVIHFPTPRDGER